MISYRGQLHLCTGTCAGAIVTWDETENRLRIYHLYILHLSSVQTVMAMWMRLKAGHASFLHIGGQGYNIHALDAGYTSSGCHNHALDASRGRTFAFFAQYQQPQDCFSRLQGYHIYVLDASRGRRGPGFQRGQDWNKKEIKQSVIFPKVHSFHLCWDFPEAVLCVLTRH
eukprot:1161733-Pelagomonas_calceolata.AAC.9